MPRAQGRLNEFMAVLFSTKVHYCNKVSIFQSSSSSVLRCFVIYLGYNPRKGAKTTQGAANIQLNTYNPRKGAKTSLSVSYDFHLLYLPRKGAKTAR